LKIRKQQYQWRWFWLWGFLFIYHILINHDIFFMEIL